MYNYKIKTAYTEFNDVVYENDTKDKLLLNNNIGMIMDLEKHLKFADWAYNDFLNRLNAKQRLPILFKNLLDPELSSMKLKIKRSGKAK